MQPSRIKVYREALELSGVDPNLAKQAAVVLANDSLELPRSERGQRIITKAHQQANL
jgi:hypothetical protein